MDNNFNSTRFSSPYFEVDTVSTPSIRAGGPSNSNVLNRYFRSLQEDLIRLGGQLATLQLQQQYLTEAVLAQSTAYSFPWALATEMISAMATSGDILWLDAHAEDFLLTDSTVASQNKRYGQWTLPIRSETDLLFTNDIYGDPWISSEANLRFLEATTDSIITDNSMTTAIDAEDLLTGKGIWLQPPNSNVSYVYKWIQLDAPLQYQSMPAICVEFDPMPCFGATLCKAYALSNTWDQLDLSYITGYDEGTDTVPNCGPVRIFFDSEDIRAVRILLKVETTAWGLGTLRLKHLEFAPNGVLKWQVPTDISSREINLARVGGKDPNDLAVLTQTIEQASFTVDLTSSDTRKSPVITHAILKFDVI